jgi:hypothetical protein
MNTDENWIRKDELAAERRRKTQMKKELATDNTDNTDENWIEKTD